MNRLVEYLMFLPFLVIALIAGLIETITGKLFDEEWHEIHVYGQMNHGQGRKRDS